MCREKVAFSDHHSHGFPESWTSWKRYSEDEGIPTGWGGGNTRGNIKVRRISSLSEYHSLEEPLWEKKESKKN